jgi:hypothetical protein
MQLAITKATDSMISKRRNYLDAHKGVLRTGPQ